MQKSVRAQVIDWRAAHVAVAAAAARAEALGVKVNIAVVDSGGNLAGSCACRGLSCPRSISPSTRPGPPPVFGFPTIDAPAILAGLPENVRAGLAGRPRVTFFGGGVPIRDGMP